jgi:alpha-galactosidase
MAPRITFVGGGSTHWTPRLLVDFVNTPSLADAAVTLVDLDADSLPPMLELAEHLRRSSGVGLQVRATTDLDEGLTGAEYVVSQLSVGGFTSMRHDLEIPARYGIRQPVGDSVGPGGISRALRSVPVLVGIARAMERVAPDATLLNVTNPLSALCRAVSRETSITVIGLCNELVGTSFVLSLLLDCGMHELDPVVGGVNHLPIITELRLGGGEDGLARLRALLDDEEARRKPIWMAPPEQIHWRKRTSHPDWTKDDVIANVPIRIEMFERFGVFPGSSDTHVAEFVPGFCTPRSDFGRDWNVRQYALDGHMDDKELDGEHLAELLATEQVPRMPSGELVAPVLDGLVGGAARSLPMNLPNRGQVTNVPEGVIVECIGTADATGAHARDAVTIPGFLGEVVRRIAASEELTVEAALTGDRTKVLEAMLTDPYAGSIPYEDTVAMTDELLAATSDWLPQLP